MQLTTLSLKDDSGVEIIGSHNLNFPAVLDSGTTNTQLPSILAQPLIDYAGAVMGPGNIGLLAPCNLASCEKTILTYGFGGKDGATINVPFSEFIESYTGDLFFADGTEACQLGIQGQSNEELAILGDTFLRSAYVVYNLDAKRIGLAQSKKNASTGSNILEINDENPIPGAEKSVNVIPLLSATEESGPQQTGQQASHTKASNSVATGTGSAAGAASSTTTPNFAPSGTLKGLLPKKASCTPKASAALEPRPYVSAAALTAGADATVTSAPQATSGAAIGTGSLPAGTGVVPSGSTVPFTGAAERAISPIGVVCAAGIVGLMLAVV